MGDHRSTGATRFVVLSWKRTGSNLLCGILHNHPNILMHNELFNPIDIFTYHPHIFESTNKQNEQNDRRRWTVLTRDLFPEDFLRFIWSARTVDNVPILPRKTQAIGFKSFPEHWIDVRNEHVWKEYVLEDLRVKKVILYREDELAVFVSTKRAEMTGHYMTHPYPSDVKVYVDPAEFQSFVNNYRHTFRKKYRSPIEKRDTFRITYEQLVDQKRFETEILPELWKFLGVKYTAARHLRETVKQASDEEDLSVVISNYDELEQCFRYTDVLHFANKRENGDNWNTSKEADNIIEIEDESCLASWSVLLPICSRPQASQAPAPHSRTNVDRKFNSNRFIDLALSSQHIDTAAIDEDACWTLLQDFCKSLYDTSTLEQLERTECIVGIDVDDRVFFNDLARDRIRRMLPCKEIVFVPIQPVMYGQLCKIWNRLANVSRNDYIILLGDDVRLLDHGWQQRIVRKFQEISIQQGLPLGAACVALKDQAFPGFPTFPVVHRWHVKNFGTLLPKQFANQGGDPYLYELYARYGAAAFDISCRLENTIGGDGDARYKKHMIDWRRHILSMNLRHLKGHLGGRKPNGVCLDIVVPSYRVNNNEYLRRIARLRSSRTDVYVRCWFVLDNPHQHHIESVQTLANELNEKQLCIDGNYFINVVHYGANRGASYARNTGYNYSTADWVLFLDDDVIPDEHLLDSYVAAIQRYPDAKVFVGQTELPEACNMWTEMLCACNVGYFYSIATRMIHPPWGVTANLLVRGSRFNPTIQFKDIYPRTGGGEDIDLVYQFKEWYGAHGRRAIVGVPEARVRHPWWNQNRPCYGQIAGWAWGDSLCITEWPSKTFLAFPNWVEHIAFINTPLTFYTGQLAAGLVANAVVMAMEHICKAIHYFSDAKKVTNGNFARSVFVAFGAGSVLSAQEVTRTVALVRRCSAYSIFRRVDWFDGEEPRIKLDIQLGSIFRFGLNAALTWSIFRWSRAERHHTV
jgi:glycosyltransferase involved in cell wall biosynthesis/LPS sulfotransferase NodH